MHTDKVKSSMMYFLNFYLRLSAFICGKKSKGY